MYFIRLLHQAGAEYASQVNNIHYRGIQTNFYFERVNNFSGFINMHLYFIRFGQEETISVQSITK
jgi:hypothetical protein